MPLCNYRMCHNLASSSYQGYCNKNHMERGLKDERDESAFTIRVGSLRVGSPETTLTLEAALTSSSRCFQESLIPGKHSEEGCFTSSSHYEVCKEPPRASAACPAKSDPSPSQTSRNPDSKS